jgi:hypothetical protein
MSVIYSVPEQYFFRIHHVRPRFKRQVENVLVYIASEISKIGKKGPEDFKKRISNAIRLFPGNENIADKTVANWRTEISSLFGMVEYDSESSWPGEIAENLAEKQDLIEFFRYFLFYFQYPGGHLKPKETCKCLRKGVLFKPAKYILALLSEAEKKMGSRFYITAVEATHCIFNDLRVTAGRRPTAEVVDLVAKNRHDGVEYDWTPDRVRYAGDILDYMVIADLLVLHGSKYYLNSSEQQIINVFLEKDVHFSAYDELRGKPDVSIGEVNALQEEWFHYVNEMISPGLFGTDLCKFIRTEREGEYSKQLLHSVSEFVREVANGKEVRTSEIGSKGEIIVHQHECMKLKKANREDLVDNVLMISDQLGMGYDIRSVEPDGTHRCIEVKSTISNRAISQKTFKLTTNEWKAAESFDGRYFVYRVFISRQEVRREDGIRLFIIQDPVGKYKSGSGIAMVPGRDGAQITYEDRAGDEERLLIWEN